MTVTTEAQLTLKAWEVEQGDYVYDSHLDDWVRVESVRHYHSEVAGWQVTLVIDHRVGLAPDAPSPMLVFGHEQEVQVSRPSS